MDGRTALSFAATFDNSETLALLLEHGADVNARWAAGDRRTVLMAVASSGHVAIADTLVAAGAEESQDATILLELQRRAWKNSRRGNTKEQRQF